MGFGFKALLAATVSVTAALTMNRLQCWGYWRFLV